jgi:hypothetical protein
MRILVCGMVAEELSNSNPYPLDLIKVKPVSLKGVFKDGLDGE